RGALSLLPARPGAAGVVAVAGAAAPGRRAPPHSAGRTPPRNRTPGRRTSAAAMVATGSAVAMVSNVWLIMRHDHPYDMYVATALLGVGVGLSFAALGTMAVEHVDPDTTAVASAVNSLVRLVGGGVASALTSAILSSDTTTGTGSAAATLRSA
ncbi:hypothetical protein ACFV4S_39480, partial [Streptomyces sp. NPDC059742]